MSLSRRQLLRRLGAGAAVTAATPWNEFALAAAAGPTAPVVSGDPVRLHRNENAYGPSPKAIEAMINAARDQACRYPEDAVDMLRTRLARRHGVSPEQIVLGCGSSEVLRMAVDAFLSPAKKLVMASPGYEWIGSCARRVGAQVVAVPLANDYAHDLEAMRARCTDDTGLVYIANPNNPTGSLTPRSNLEAFIQSLPPSIGVVIDEAYHHYVSRSADYTSFIDRRLADPRVIVTRSFSKIYGLAGLRVGYGVAPPQTALRLAANRLSDAVNSVAAYACAAALDDEEHVRTSVVRNDNAKQEFLNQANARMVRAIESHTNFVTMNTNAATAHTVEFLSHNGVLVAPVAAPLDTYLRVSLGSAAEARAFWKAWDAMPNKKMM